jgi:response regulator RpfG family c-di-GMP phosphodiesterase
MTEHDATIDVPQDAKDKRALAGIRVLLVDDDDDIRDAFEQVLELYGADVQPAASTRRGARGARDLEAGRPAQRSRHAG